MTQVHQVTAFAFTLMIFGHAFLNRRRIRAWFARKRPPRATPAAS